MHICIPYSKKFTKIVLENIKNYNPKLVIIHSTVPVGTTKRIFNKYPHIVHSPIRGVHPNLFEGIKTFIKYIGSDDAKVGLEAYNHLHSLGIHCATVENSKTTELGKLLDTTYYGACIAFHGLANKLCKRFGLKFDDVMTDFNYTYNEGYRKLGKLNVNRPVLQPPQNNTIGGHCVIPNAMILLRHHSCNDDIVRAVLQYKGRKTTRRQYNN
jgi:UDP-N-acetyl-D-mannosaminuronate dehydrogenase